MSNYSASTLRFVSTILLLILVSVTGISSAQTPPRRFDFLLSSGSVVPTGAQRDAIRRGHVSIAQFSYALLPSLAGTASIGWARSRDLASSSQPKLDVFTYDLGLESRSQRRDLGRRFSVSTLAGIGVGARSYDVRGVKMAPTHNAAGYASLGGELGYRRVRVRLELRDYITGFRSLRGHGTSGTRNDVVTLVGLRFVKR